MRLINKLVVLEGINNTLTGMVKLTKIADEVTAYVKLPAEVDNEVIMGVKGADGFFNQFTVERYDKVLLDGTPEIDSNVEIMLVDKHTFLPLMYGATNKKSYDSSNKMITLFVLKNSEECQRDSTNSAMSIDKSIELEEHTAESVPVTIEEKAENGIALMQGIAISNAQAVGDIEQHNDIEKCPVPITVAATIAVGDNRENGIVEGEKPIAEAENETEVNTAKSCEQADQSVFQEEVGDCQANAPQSAQHLGLSTEETVALSAETTGEMYLLLKENIEALFEGGESNEELSALLPNSRWVWQNKNTPSQHSIGIICIDGEEVLGYAVKGAQDEIPSANPNFQWLAGYWLLFSR